MPKHEPGGGNAHKLFERIARETRHETTRFRRKYSETKFETDFVSAPHSV
jgi:hypothetical protein